MGTWVGKWVRGYVGAPSGACGLFGWQHEPLQQSCGRFEAKERSNPKPFHIRQATRQALLLLLLLLPSRSISLKAIEAISQFYLL